jgi:hypothetical protein
LYRRLFRERPGPQRGQGEKASADTSAIKIKVDDAVKAPAAGFQRRKSE